MNIGLKIAGTPSLNSAGEIMSYGMTRVCWEDDEYRYHVNIERDGSLPPRTAGWSNSAKIHRNSKDNRRDGYKALDLYAKKYAPIREAIVKFATPDSIKAHMEAEADKQRATTAAVKAERSAKMRAAMADELDRLRSEQLFMQADALQEAFAELTDEQVYRLAEIIRSA